jgi:hypothetical protein
LLQGIPAAAEVVRHRSKRNSHLPAGKAAVEAGKASGPGLGEAGRIPDRPGCDLVGTADHMGEDDPAGRRIVEVGIGRKRVGPTLLSALVLVRVRGTRGEDPWVSPG